MRESKSVKTPREFAKISVEAKSRLAKLLATENITVEHRNVETAYFDVKNRILCLPNWTGISEDLYDLLVLHEVGHALYTPAEGWHDAICDRGENFKGFLNITEDARIEKKQKRKYPGGRKAFINGYKELVNKGFFGVAPKDYNTLNLIDRINLYCKGGAVETGIKFSKEEAPFVKDVEAAESFDEAEAAAVALYEYMSMGTRSETDIHVNWGNTPISADDNDDDNDSGETGLSIPAGEGDDHDSDDDDDNSSASGDNDDSESGAGDGSVDSEDSDSDGDEGSSSASGDNDDSGDEDSSDANSDGSDGDSDEDSDNHDSPSGAGSELGEPGAHQANVNAPDGRPANEPKSSTDKAFRENSSSLVDSDKKTGIDYVQIPDDDVFNLKSIIIDPDTVHNALFEYNESNTGTAARERANADLKTFKSDNSKIVNYLAKEFEMRKAAASFSRTSVSRSGTIDTNKLSSYRWSEDIFKKVADIPKGKSHGLVLFVDWSGSMHSNIPGSIDQILNLALFCKKVNIPFDVYAFSDSAAGGEAEKRLNESGESVSHSDLPNRMYTDKLKLGDYDLRGYCFNLIHLLSSTAKTAKFNRHMAGMMILRGCYTYGPRGRGSSYDDPGSSWGMPGWLHLGGTPLNETIMTAIPVVNAFRAKNSLQVVNVVFLTDGDGCDLYNTYDPDPNAPRTGRYDHTRDRILRDRKTKKEWLIAGSRRSFGAAMIDALRHRTGCKVSNFYIVSGTAALRHTAMRLIEPGRLEELVKRARADGGLVLEDSPAGWDHHYLVMEENLEIAVEGLGDAMVGAKKGVLKRAFSKSSSGKLRNRVILRKFTELIAA